MGNECCSTDKSAEQRERSERVIVAHGTGTEINTNTMISSELGSPMRKTEQVFINHDKITTAETFQVPIPSDMDISGFADNFVENDEHVPIRYYDYNKHAN